MRKHPASVVVVIALALVATGCASGSSRQASKGATAATGPVAAAKHLDQTIELPRRTLVFRPTRDDLSVGCAVFSVVSSHPIRVNGVEPDSRWSYIYLRQVGKNRFEMPALKIEYSLDEPGAILCISAKVWFNEVSNKYDSDLYERRDDRYALVSWCTSPPELSADTSYKARFSENRVQKLDEFNQILSRPFVIRLKQRPLRAEWGYPMINNQGRKLSEADVKEVERLVRDRDERYLIAISVVDADHADVTASVGDATRFHGTRVYKCVRKEGGWRIESVANQPNISRFVFW